MIPVRELKVIWESDLSRLVSETYGQPFSYQQLNMLPNDSIYGLEIYEITPAEEFYSGSYWQQTLAAFKKWKHLEQPADMENLSWRLYMEREMGGVPFDNQAIWSDLVSRGLLTPGDYHLHVWW